MGVQRHSTNGSWLRVKLKGSCALRTKLYIICSDLKKLRGKSIAVEHYGLKGVVAKI